MLAKLTDFIVDSLEKRTRFPFLIPLAAAVAGCNWTSLLVLLFSEMSIEQKITYVQENTSFLTVSVYPILTGATYLFLMPLAVRYASKWRLHCNKNIELDRLNDENTILQREIETVAEKRNQLAIMHENMITSVQAQRRTIDHDAKTVVD